MSVVFASPGDLRPRGQFAVYEGREFPFSSGPTDGQEPPRVVYLHMQGSELASFPPGDVVEMSRPDVPRPNVGVPMARVARFYTRGHLARWFGEDVGVMEVIDEDRVRIMYDRDPRLAELMGMVGSQYDGYWADVPFTELDDVQEVVRPIMVYGWPGYDPVPTVED